MTFKEGDELVAMWRRQLEHRYYLALAYRAFLCCPYEPDWVSWADYLKANRN